MKALAGQGRVVGQQGLALTELHATVILLAHQLEDFGGSRVEQVHP